MGNHWKLSALPSSMLPDSMCPILNLLDHTKALRCTLEGASCFREVSLPCQVAKPGLITFLQSANGCTVMPTAVCALPGLYMPCAHAPASSLQFVDEQELLSVTLEFIASVSRIFVPLWLYELLYGLPLRFCVWFLLGVVLCLLLFGFCSFCLAAWQVTRS